jgi:ACS family glucarate transporter-like MFS transporter
MSRPRVESAPSSLAEPTRARYGVVGFAVALAVIQYIDRVCISQAAPLVSEDLRLSPRQMGYVFSAFTLAYALFEIPTGYLGDRIGPRKVLLRVVLWWSFFTAATGWAWSWLSLVATRFLFGAGEAGCFPNLAKALHRWLPTNERTRAQGLLWMSARWGGAATPLLVYFCLQHVHWRTAFLLRGLPPSSPGSATTLTLTRPSTPPRPRSSRRAPLRPRATSACRGASGCARGPCGACADSTPP